jgi:hypothetical protein
MRVYSAKRNQPMASKKQSKKDPKPFSYGNKKEKWFSNPAIILTIILAIISITVAILAAIYSNSSFPDLSQCKSDLSLCISRTPEVIIETQIVKQTELVNVEVPIAVTITAVPSESEDYQINITEVMTVPWSKTATTTAESWNEYIELYNYGDEEVDVAGWWISDGGDRGQPDKIIYWDERFRGYDFGEGIKTNTTIINPGCYALILAPKYIDGDQPYSDLIMSGTIILTIAKQDDPIDNDLLGDVKGLEGSSRSQCRDVLVLYIGDKNKIVTIVSTYGAPNVESGMNPHQIKPNLSAGLPLSIDTWGGAERKDASKYDILSNWRVKEWHRKTLTLGGQ